MHPRPRRRPPFLAPLITLAVALGVAVVPASVAQAEPTEATTITVQLSRTWGVFYDGIGPAIPEDTFTVSGDLTRDSDGAPLEGQTVELGRAKKTASDFVTVAEATTDANGHFVFAQRVVSTADYATRYLGDATNQASVSDSTERLDGVRDFNAGKRKVDGRLYFRGTVRPSWNNRTVTLQKKACGTCAWRTVTSKRTGASGAWSFRVYYPRSVGPVWRWQAVLAAAGDFEKSYSAQLTTQRVYGRTAAARLR